MRDIEVRTLADSAAALASTLDRAVAFDEGEWRHRIESGSWWLAEEAGRPGGVVADYPGDGDERHLAAMWVEPRHRGTGTADRPVETLCALAREGASAVALRVADADLRSRRFYQRVGFMPTGERQLLPSAPEVGEELLRRPLTA